VKRSFAAAAAAAALLVSYSCTSTPAPTAVNTAPKVPPSDLKQGLKAVGSESDVVVTAHIFNGNYISTSSTVTIVYEIENRRATPIAVADIVPATSYDALSRTILVQLGSEVPGLELLPRLVEIAPGMSQKFTVGAHTNIQVPYIGAILAVPRQLQIKINFLGDVQPFAQLVNIPQKAVHDRVLASDLFPKWVERNETVLMNTLPIHWTVSLATEQPDASTSVESGRRRGRRP
jgi:hypothetical protein